MCELFAMSSSEPANVTFSLGVFGERGGRLGPHRDGWGLAFAERRDFRIVKEAEPAASSACMRFVESNEIRSTIVISHLRLATGRRIVSYENTHPFARELYGRTHVLAHNGDVPGVLDDPRFAPSWHFPLGETDSERAFCALMDRLRAALAPDTGQDLAAKLPIVRQWAGELARHGTANFLLSDGEHLFAHRSTRLFVVERSCPASNEALGSDSLRASLTTSGATTQRVALVATQPLTLDEAWAELPAGEVVVLRRGRRVVA
jgi:glutamine amidotransferase